MNYFRWEVIPSQRGAHKKRVFVLLCVTMVDFEPFVVVNDLSF